MNKPRTKLEIEYIVVPEERPGEKLNMAFSILFGEVMKDRKAKIQAKKQVQNSLNSGIKVINNSL